MDSAALTPARRAVAAALLFLGSAALAGVHLVAEGVRYRVPGLPEGVFALLLTYVLLLRRGWIRPAGWLGWLAVGYGTAANAQLLELLLPPPGVIEWMVVFVLAFAAWGALTAGTRTRLMASLASLALLLALLKFSVIPVLWERVGPAPGEAFGLGNAAESVRRILAEHEPTRPAGQLVGLLALGLWALGTRLLWDDPAPDPGDAAEIDTGP
ncbi:MAG TPA: hypothetical protein VGR37_12915 [Longimicrobiaceae bacterium]|nr:hypothetical protein [Longimicrobiaceae bacterium]